MKLRKLFAAGLALVMTLAMAAPTMAATITVNPAVEGQTYSAYKIFDVTKNDAEQTGYSYTMDSQNAWFAKVKEYADVDDHGLTLTQVGQTNTYNVSVRGSDEMEDDGVTVKLHAFSAVDFAAYLDANKAGKTPEASVKATTADGDAAAKAVLEVAGEGYYFVDSSLGSLCILNTTDTNAEIKEKNSEPTIDKKIDGTKEKADAEIGDTIHYTITVTTPAKGKADTDYIVHDEMTDGLTFLVDTVAIKVDGANVADTNYEIKTTGLSDNNCAFEITFKQEYIATLAAEKNIVITYDAILNDEAVTGSAANPNTAYLTYGETSSTKVTAKVYTYEFDLVKTDAEGKVLDFATFALYNAEKGGNLISLVKESDNVYRVATEAEKNVEGFTSATIEAKHVTIKGLSADANKHYYLEELSTLRGYNLLTERKEVPISGNNPATVTDGSYVSGGIQVINYTGIELPSTGGIGTTLFYIVGGLMVVCAGVVLVTKKRMGNK